MSASLVNVLYGVTRAHKSGDEVASNDDRVIESVIHKIKPEFQDDFRRLVMDWNFKDVPRLEFLAYWESDEGCQEAIKEVLEPIVLMAQEFVDAMRAVAEWKP